MFCTLPCRQLHHEENIASNLTQEKILGMNSKDTSHQRENMFDVSGCWKSEHSSLILRPLPSEEFLATWEDRTRPVTPNPGAPTSQSSCSGELIPLWFKSNVSWEFNLISGFREVCNSDLISEN